MSSIGTQRKNGIARTQTVSKKISFTSQTSSEDQITPDRAVALPIPAVSGDMKHLDEKIESLMSRGENMMRCGTQMKTEYVCKVCGKKDMKTNLKVHIEGIHMDGISIPCPSCEKNLGSRDSLRSHISRVHRDNK